jgi:mono/diheme cytochrome c family protein
MPMTYSASLSAMLIAAVLAVPVSICADDPPKPVAQASVDFDRDVKPIFAKHCISCHGPEKQKHGLRLDRKADALKGGDSGLAVVPGKSVDSLLFQLVSGQDKDRQMPPKLGLSAAEISTLKAWIDQGAKWPDDGSTAVNPTDWWSLKPLAKPSVPTVPNSIDQFILAKLRDKGLSPSPEADRRTLIRRVYFDLTGLPPTPEAIESFAKDNAPDAYEKLVDSLLASPRYGERWARHWLDVVHFGETHGYDKDQPRPNAWPYRDYVIRAFNTDKPYSRFVQEQVAGDVLFPGTVDGIEALGFLAAGPWDFIGHVEVPESKIDGKVARHLDRDDFVANTIGTFMGLTVHCAQCHNHKFDPIAQEDYYRLQAVFAAIDRTDKAYDADPKTTARRAELETQKHAAGTKITAIQDEARRKAGPEFAMLEKQIAEASRPTNLPKPPEYGYHSSLSAKQDNAKWVQVDLGVSVKLDRVVLRPCHDEFNDIGAGFGFPVRFKVEVSDDAAFKTGVATIADHTTRDFANPGTAPVIVTANGKSGRYIRVTATKLAPRQNDYILALAELEVLDTEGKNRAAKVIVSALDSIEAPIRWRKSNLTDGLYPPGPKLAAEEITKLTERRDALLKTALGETGAADLAATQATLQTIDAELGKLAGMRKVAYIGTIHTSSGTFSGTGPFGGKPRPIHILPRGDVTKPGKEVGPGAIAAIPGINGTFELPPNHTEGDRRAALARWLTDPNNPLTWRVMANRVWQYHFGRGLVDTPNDFGKMGQLPTHPELLDWLAAELREHQSLKKLHKLILMSATYRQTSNIESGMRNGQLKIRLFGIEIPASAFHASRSAIDGDNRYLWRQNRRKLEAEAVRDSILFVAGKLDLTMGGPSFQDFVIEKPEHSPHYEYQLFDPENPKGHRRAVYRFIVRSKQQPFLAALDCADPSLAVDKRNETLTPQQALTLLNNTLSVAMAKHFALRVEKLATDDVGRVRAAFRLALGREPTAQERDALAAYIKEYGLANGCRVILNLNEFVFVD